MLKVKVTGLNTLHKHLERLRSLDNKFKEFLERLAQIGIDTATVKFQSAQYDGTNDVVVEQSPLWLSDNTLCISASGEKILFIEFGTGVHYVEQHPQPIDGLAARGTYGAGKGSNDSWAYIGEGGTNGELVATKKDGRTVYQTHGNPPANAMYEAAKNIRDNVMQIAREVFSE